MNYIELYQSGELSKRIKELAKYLYPCNLCPNSCGVDRTSGEVGICRSPILPRVASYNLHFGEEPPLVGAGGSGTIFFSGCSLHCVFCQNYPISHYNVGNDVSIQRLAEMMMELQNSGAVNINLVTPTHYVHAVLEALPMAIEMGLSVPIVFNSSGYERVDVLKILEGVVDIYLPDAKYGDNSIGRRYSKVDDYWDVNRVALKEMFRQMGENLVVGNDGVALRGMIIRHLVLPSNVSNSVKVLRFIAEELSVNLPISLMSQYFPAFRASRYAEINRRLYLEEYEEVKEAALSMGFTDLWVQDIG